MHDCLTPPHPHRRGVPGRHALHRDTGGRAETRHRWPHLGRRFWGLVAAVLLAVAVWTLRDRIPGPDRIGAAFGQARWDALALAVLAALLSVVMFARQQQRVLHAHGVTMRLRHAVALSYARSAIAAALPAGSAVSAGYAYRRFRAEGADRVTATSATVVSGAASTIGLVLLYLVGTALAAILAPDVLGGTREPLIASGAILLVGAIVLHAARARAAETHRRRVPFRDRHRHTRPGGSLAPVAAAVRAMVTLPRADVAAAVAAAVLNWLADLACLQAAVLAFDLHVHPVRLAATYLAAQLLRQIPLTPGGIGVIETGLVAGLTATGMAAAPATAAVLVYRVLTCWLVLPVGLAAWAVLRRIVSGNAPGERVASTDGR